MIKHTLLAVTLALAPIAAEAVTLNPDQAVSVTNFGVVTPRVDVNRTRVGDFYRHALFFDLTGLSGTVTGATLRFLDGVGTQVTVGSSRTYNVWDVTTPFEKLERTFLGMEAAEYYTDLGSGVLHGSTTFAIQPTNGANPLPSPSFEVDLIAGLDTISDGLGSRIALGGQSAETFYIFSGAAELSKIELELDLSPMDSAAVVPLPGPGLLLVSSMLALWFRPRTWTERV